MKCISLDGRAGPNGVRRLPTGGTLLPSGLFDHLGVERFDAGGVIGDGDHGWDASA